MKRFVVNILDLIASIAFFTLVFLVPVLVALVQISGGGGLTQGIVYGLGTFVAALFIGTLGFGTLFLLLEMNQNLRTIAESQRKP